MKIESVPIEYNSRLVNAYLRGYPEMGCLFEHQPGNPLAFRDRYEIIRRDYHTDRSEMVRILTEYNQSLHCSEAARENLQKLKDPETVVIITGQQAGILTGPLYTIYKAVTAIQLAAEVYRRTGIKAVPVFWVAAEDHDYAEIDHLDFVDCNQKLSRLKLDFLPEGKLSVGNIPVTAAVFDLIGRLEEETNPSEWKENLLNKVRELAVRHENLADWFAAIMSWLFAKHGLILINPLNRDLRRLLSGAFAAFLRHTGDVNERLKSGIAKVREFGVPPQVETAENNAHLFYYLDGERLPLVKEDDHFTVRGRDGKWTLAELTGIALNSPHLLSPNVVLRPVAQDILLPIMAYVGGPGEISYYALYRDIYPLFGQSMPIIYPRINITLVERGVAKNMEAYGVRFDEGAAGLQAKLKRYLAEQDRVGIDALFEKYTKELGESFRELTEKISGTHPELLRYSHETLGKILHQVGYLEKKTRQYHRKAYDTAVKRFRNMENQLFPRNNWQERVFNIFPYMFKYGPAFVDRLTELPLLENFDHKLIYLGE